MAGLNDHRALDLTFYEPDSVDPEHRTEPVTMLLRPIRIALSGAVVFGVSYMLPPAPQETDAETYPVSHMMDGLPHIDSAQTEAMNFIHADALPPDSSLFGQRIRFTQPDGTTIDLFAEKSPFTHEVSIEVNGKRYTIDDNPLLPGIALGTVIDSATNCVDTYQFDSNEYGTAFVRRTEIECMLRHVANDDGDTVTLIFDANFIPKSGSPLEAIIAAKTATMQGLALFTGNKPAEKPTYTLTLKRVKTAPAVLAYIDNHVPDGLR